MNRNFELSATVLIVTSFSIPSFGSQIHCRPLREVLPLAKLVFVATVEKVELVPGETKPVSKETDSDVKEEQEKAKEPSPSEE